MARRKKSARRWHALLRTELPLPAALLALWLIGLLEPWLYLGALVRELGFHLLLVAAACALWAAGRRHYVAALVLSGVGALFALPWLPFYRSTRPTPQSGPVLRVASAHLASAELTTHALADWLARVRPDALALTGLRSELGQADFEGFRVARGRDPRSLLLVRSELALAQREALRGNASQLLRAGRCRARIVTLELPAIAAYADLDRRAREIAAARAIPSAPRSVWLGQLGSRADAHDLAPFISDHQLRDARIGHGRLATAPGSLGPLGFPLSHILVHGWISVREVALAPPLAPGADRVLTASLELTEPRCREALEFPHE
ncbi:MAG TPA: hypothetical protein VI299_24955 [Polyangiales bacterium]